MKTALNTISTCMYTNMHKGIFAQHMFWWGSGGFPRGSNSKKSACNARDLVWSLGQEDSLEKGMATHSSILVWRSLWTEEPGGLQSIGLQRVGHDRATNTDTYMFWGHIFERKISVRTVIQHHCFGEWFWWKCDLRQYLYLTHSDRRFLCYIAIFILWDSSSFTASCLPPGGFWSMI